MDSDQMERELAALTEELNQIRKEVECRTIRLEVRERIRERLRQVELRLQRQHERRKAEAAGRSRKKA